MNMCMRCEGDPEHCGCWPAYYYEGKKPEKPHNMDGFWGKIVKGYECWYWIGARDRNGYGVFGQLKAHRYAYTLLVGEIPQGLGLDHLCRVRRCVNPKHLEPVTQAENNRRKPKSPFLFLSLSA